MAAAKSNKSKKFKLKKKQKRTVVSGKVHVSAHFNNTIVTICDLSGNVLSWATAGTNFKGSKKSTPFAAQKAAQTAAAKARDTYGMREVNVFVKGPGPGRDSAVRSVAEFFKVLSITDLTAVAHNGVRGEKERRV